MHVECAFVCDYARVEAQNLHAMGIGWKFLRTETVPYIYSSMYFAAHLSGGPAEVGKYAVLIELVGPDTSVVVEVKADLEFIAPLADLDGYSWIVAHFKNVTLPRFGLYEVRLTVEGEEMAGAEFRVVRP